jgi:hypothetical protein
MSIGAPSTGKKTRELVKWDDGGTNRAEKRRYAASTTVLK